MASECASSSNHRCAGGKHRDDPETAVDIEELDTDKSPNEAEAEEETAVQSS
jgi:hypothetical protein